MWEHLRQWRQKWFPTTNKPKLDLAIQVRASYLLQQHPTITDAELANALGVEQELATRYRQTAQVLEWKPPWPCRFCQATEHLEIRNWSWYDEARAWRCGRCHSLLEIQDYLP
jgi:hypothetical protein